MLFRKGVALVVLELKYRSEKKIFIYSLIKCFKSEKRRDCFHRQPAEPGRRREEVGRLWRFLQIVQDHFDRGAMAAWRGHRAGELHQHTAPANPHKSLA